MKWLLLWVVLVVLAGVVLGSLAWGLFRKVLALGAELGRSAGTVGPVLDQLQEPYHPASSVLSDPTSTPQVRPARSGHRRSSAVPRRLSVGRRQPRHGRVG